MARVSASVLLGLLGPLSTVSTLSSAACGPTARDSQAMPRIESAMVAAHKPAPQANVVHAEPTTLAASAPQAPDREATSIAAGERALVRPLAATRDTWEARLRKIPELSRYAGRFVPFDGAAASAALKRGERSRGSVNAWSIADGPFAWSPDARSELFVAAGSIGERALVAVLEVQPGGVLRHAASLVIDDAADTSVALGSSSTSPRELLWTTCYGCPGEGGSIVLGDDGRPRFVYR